MLERRVTFHSDGHQLAGVLRLPPGAAPEAPRPAVCFCAGMSLVKEVWLPAQAERLVEAGFVTLNFDYSGFGESEGSPRRRLLPWRQVRDVGHALTFLASLPEVDEARLGLSGTSLGAAVSIAAAADPRVKAAVGVAGPMDLGRVWSRFAGFPAFRAKVARARERYVAAGEVSYVSVASLLKSDPATCALLQEEVERYPTWSLEITYESLLDLFAFDAERDLPATRAALLWVAPERDELIAGCEAQSAFAKAREPKGIVILPEAEHVDVYRAESPAHQRLLDEQLAWFQRYLGPSGPQGAGIGAGSAPTSA